MADAKVLNAKQILIEGDIPPQAAAALRLVQREEADIPLKIQSVSKAPGPPGATLVTTTEALDPRAHYLITSRDLGQSWSINPSVGAIIISTVIAAALINNFVFTRYLGLCVFFGVSKKRDTAIGMGITFTIVAALSGFLSWVIHRFVLTPLKLEFLQIMVFIGIIAALVQASDTILKKVQPLLHRKFGIYLVLITTNCIILAVPLLNAATHATVSEAMSLSVGSGLGFALALFLMSCAREAVELAPVPPVFRGLPIAFIIAGLFALSFLGFSGLQLL